MKKLLLFFFENPLLTFFIYLPILIIIAGLFIYGAEFIIFPVLLIFVIISPIEKLFKLIEVDSGLVGQNFLPYPTAFGTILAIFIYISLIVLINKIINLMRKKYNDNKVNKFLIIFFALITLIIIFCVVYFMHKYSTGF